MLRRVHPGILRRARLLEMLGDDTDHIPESLTPTRHQHEGTMNS